MSRTTATAAKEAQPDLLGGGTPSHPQAKTTKNAVAKIEKIPPKAPAKRDGEPRNMLAIIAEAAANPAVDVAKMQALLDMQRQLETEQHRREAIVDFATMQSDLPSVRTDGKIEIREKDAQGGRSGRLQQATPYATFQGIMKVVKPILRRNHFSLWYSTEPTPDGTRIIVIGHLDHDNGHSRETRFPLPAETSGSKNNVQGWGSAMSYGKRYATIALLNIVSHATEDADRDGAPPKKPASGSEAAPEQLEGVAVISQEQHDKLIDAIESAGRTRKEFCAAWKIEKIADLPADHYERAMKACKDMAGTRG